MEWDDVFAQKNYSVIDFETSGLKPEIDYIIEIGLLEVINDVPMATIGWIMNPNFPEAFHIPAEVTAITGITDTEITYGADPRELFPSFINRIRWLPVWGHNLLRFDYLFIDGECKRSCTITPPNGIWFDTAAIFKAWQLTLPDKQWSQEPTALDEIENYSTFYDYGMYILNKRIRGLKYNLGFCCETLNVDTTGMRFHRAGADVTATYRVREALKKMILG